MNSGLDPEFFAIDGRGSIVPASKFIPKVLTESPTGQLDHDNAAIEIRPGQGQCLHGVISRTRSLVMQAHHVMRLARRQGKIPSSTNISITPAAKLQRADMRLESVGEFGCSPALLAQADLTAEEVVPFSDPTTDRWRSAGFHVHHSFLAGGSSVYDGATGGYDVIPKSMDAPLLGIKYSLILDSMIGLVDVMMMHRAGFTKESKVRRLGIGYGRAGEFRVRRSASSSGWIYEYRTLSPWPISHPMWVWWAESAVRQIVSRTRVDHLDFIIRALPDHSEVAEAINNCDNAAAEKLWLRAITAFGTRGGEGGDSLHTDNLQKLIWALQDNGHAHYTLDWTIFRAWSRNSGNPYDPDHLAALRTSWVRHYEQTYHRKPTTAQYPAGYRWNRVGHRYRYFPSAAGGIQKDHHEDRAVNSGIAFIGHTKRGKIDLTPKGLSRE